MRIRCEHPTGIELNGFRNHLWREEGDKIIAAEIHSDLW